MLMAFIFGGILVVATLVTTCRVISMRRLLGYATAVDVVFSLGVFVVFGSTFAGLAAASIAGLIMAITLSVLRKGLGYDRLRFVSKDLRTPANPDRWQWVHTPRSHMLRWPRITVRVH